MNLCNLLDVADSEESVKSEPFFGVCQCCLSEEKLKNMLHTHMHEGNIEMYSDMLNKCFSIEVQSNETGVESLYLICESCVQKLRDCFSFRLKTEKSQLWLKEAKNRRGCHSSDLSECKIKVEYSDDDLSDHLEYESDMLKIVQKPKAEKKKKTSRVRVKRRIENLKIVRRNISKKILSLFPKEEINAMSKVEYHRLYNKVYHSELKPFKLEKNSVTCHVCQDTFKSHKTLADHMRIHYPNYVCDICGKYFVTKKYLEKHIIRHDNDKVPCHICKKLLKKSTLGDHIRRHTGVKTKHRCSLCVEVFEDYYKRQEHMEKAHSIDKPRYQCLLCPKSFGYSSALSRHIRSFHQEEKNFVCGECGREFYCRKSFNDHSIVHSKERNFQCVICFKSYGRKNTLNQHMKIHNDKKQHICPQCGRAFTQKCTLVCHLKVHQKAESDASQTILM